MSESLLWAFAVVIAATVAFSAGMVVGARLYRDTFRKEYRRRTGRDPFS